MFGSLFLARRIRIADWWRTTFVRLQIDRLTFAIALAFGLAAKGPATLALDTDQAAAQQDFLELCSDCHGSDARGNGPMTKNLTKIPPDLTQISKRAGGKFDEKAVFDWIIGLNMPTSHGTCEMPIWGRLADGRSGG